MKAKIVISAILITIIGLTILVFTKQPEIPLNEFVHAHALINIYICDQHHDLPRTNSTSTAHGKKYLGLPNLHTHDDNVIHLEGIIQRKEDMTLGKFFDAINVTFDQDRIIQVKNGDLCQGKPAVLKMYVNNKRTHEFRNYIPFNVEEPKKQIISLLFEPEN